MTMLLKVVPVRLIESKNAPSIIKQSVATPKIPKITETKSIAKRLYANEKRITEMAVEQSKAKRAWVKTAKAKDVKRHSLLKGTECQKSLVERLFKKPKRFKVKSGTETTGIKSIRGFISVNPTAVT